LFPHFSQLRLTPQQIDGVTRHGVYVSDIGEKSADAVLDHFRHASSSCGDGHNFAGHSFERGQSERFQFARHQHYIRKGEFFANLILFSKKQYMLVNAFLHRQPFCLRTVGTVADQQELCGNLLANAIEDFDDIEHALYRTKIRKVY